jgi:hypothetical protein
MSHGYAPQTTSQCRIHQSKKIWVCVRVPLMSLERGKCNYFLSVIWALRSFLPWIGAPSPHPKFLCTKKHILSSDFLVIFTWKGIKGSSNYNTGTARWLSLVLHCWIHLTHEKVPCGHSLPLSSIIKRKT